MHGFALKQSKKHHPGIYQESKLIKRYVAILKLIFAQSYFYIFLCFESKLTEPLGLENLKWNIQ